MATTTAQHEKRILGVSIKMYLDLDQTQAYITQVAQLAKAAEARNVDLFVAPDFVSISSAAQTLAGTSVHIGAQDCASEATGPFTGEVSVRTLKQAGVKIVVVGHAERRSLYGETNQIVARKAGLIAQEGMIPLICVGEIHQSSITSQGVGIAVSECKPQIEAALSAVPDSADVIIAYEPVWAIGASQAASADHVLAVVSNLRALLAKRTGSTRIVYGGSAQPGTFTTLKDGVDGLFLGRFAHDVSNVAKILEEMS